MLRIKHARIESGVPAASLSIVFWLHLIGLFLVCLLVATVSSAQTPKPSPQTGPRRPLPKLSNGARGFDTTKKPADASARLIAVGGGWGAEEEPKKPRLKSKTALGYFKLGNEYLSRLNFDKAIQPLERAVKLNPNYLPAYESLGYAYAYDGVSPPNDIQDKEYMLKRYRLAIGAFEQARRLAPRKDYLHLNLGVLYFNTAQYQKAIDSFKEGLRLSRKTEDFTIPIMEGTTLTEVYEFIAEGYEYIGQNADAISSYQQALRIKPTESKLDVYWQMGQLYEELGEADQALASYQNVAKIFDSEPTSTYLTFRELYSRIGAIYAAQQKYGEAADAFSKSVSIYAEDLDDKIKSPPEADANVEAKKEWEEQKANSATELAQALYNRGVAQLNVNQIEKGIESLKRALELDPNYHAARFNLGFAYLTLGDKDAAREQAQILKVGDSQLAKELEELINR